MIKNKIGYLLVSFFLFPLLSSAHVAYVISEENATLLKGEYWGFLFSAISDVKNIVLILGTMLFAMILFIYVPRISVLRNVGSSLAERVRTYHEFTPWIIRISLGIALLGAGTSNLLISPTLPHMDPFAIFQVVLGFLFMIGFLLIPSALCVIVLYAIALSHSIYMLGNIETLALAVGFLAFHSYRPGLDDVLNFKLFKRVHFSREWVPFILRMGMGITMIFLALYEKILNPLLSNEVVLEYSLTNIVPVSAGMWVLSAGIIELLIGVFLLCGMYTRAVSLITFIFLSTSFFFFKESVTAHITLFGLLIVLMIEGGGKWSFDTFFRKETDLKEN